MKRILFVLVSILGLGAMSYADSAYNVVTISSATTIQTETDFLATVASQFSASIVKNPLVSNTYTIKLFGPNPNYDPAPTRQDMARYIATVDSWTYPAGFANGEDYGHGTAQGIVENYLVNCSTPIAGADHWDAATCEVLTSAIDQDIFRLKNSTPTVVPGGFQ